MNTASASANDQTSLQSVNHHSILEVLDDAGFQNVCRLAVVVCGLPDAMVGIHDAQGRWLRAAQHGKPCDMPAKLAWLPAAKYRKAGIFIIPDVTADARLAAPGIRFFAAVPLGAAGQPPVGALCIADAGEHSPGAECIQSLKALAGLITSQTALEKKIVTGEQKQDELKRAYADLEKFSYIVSHDLRSPLNNIISLTHLLKDEYGDRLDDEGSEYITFLNVAAYQLSDLVTGILEYSKSSRIAVEEEDDVDLAALIGELVGQLNLPADAEVRYDMAGMHVTTSRVALRHILLHLLQNAAKYHDKRPLIIEVTCVAGKNAYTFTVKDNGTGIAPEDQHKIFELFERLHKKKDGESMGIGLAVVRRLVEKLGGAIHVESEKGKGAAFVFTIAR